MQYSAELVQFSAVQLRDLVGAREISPVEVARAHLEQIAAHNPRLNAICTVSDQVQQEARQLEQKLMRGNAPALAGVPVGIKDVTQTAGIRTTFGSPLFRDYIPGQDALVVQRLRKAGALIMGKTNTPEFAAGGNTFNEVFGCTRNPWNPELTAGGSTGGGAAALASGMIALAEGTDLGGSLRIPASFCGVVGLRPSPGTVPTYPSDFLWDTLQVTGPMARNAEDVAIMLEAISGGDGRSPLSTQAVGPNLLETIRRRAEQNWRIAYAPDPAGINVETVIARVCGEAANKLGEGVDSEQVDLDLSFGRPAFLSLRGLWMVVQQLSRLDRLDELGVNLAGNVRQGLEISTRQLAEAEAVRGKIWALFGRFFEDFDALLTPCVAVSPFPVTENFPTHIAGRSMETYIDWFAPTFLLSLAGLPIASVPCGVDETGMPVGLQVVGRPNQEGEVLALAHRIQHCHPVGLPELV